MLPTRANWSISRLAKARQSATTANADPSGGRRVRHSSQPAPAYSRASTAIAARGETLRILRVFSRSALYSAPSPRQYDADQHGRSTSAVRLLRADIERGAG